MNDILTGCLAATAIMAIITVLLYGHYKRAVERKPFWFFVSLLSGTFCFFCASSSALIFVANLP